MGGAQDRHRASGADPGTTPDVQVACIWVHIDPERLLPSPIHQIELDAWTGPSTRTVKARLRHPAPSPDADEGSWTFRAAELDIAQHINNAAFWTPLDDELLSGNDEPAGVEAEIEYRSPAQPGPKRLLTAGANRWLVDPAGAVGGATDGEVLASMVVGPVRSGD